MAMKQCCKVWRLTEMGDLGDHARGAAVFGWLAEAFDTADLEEAKSLLEKISRPPS